MIHLMKLEMQKNRIRTYIYASIIITITMIGFIYLFAYAPQIEPNDPDMLIFAGYDNLIRLYGVVNMAIFCVFSCVMYTRFIIEAYNGNQLMLLFSYPINQQKILLSKIFIVVLFTSFSIIICNTIVFSIFSITESFIPIMTDAFSITFMLLALKTTIFMMISAASLSVIATGIGFFTKSVPSTIIAGVLLSSIFCNIVFHSLTNDRILFIFMIVALLASTVITFLLMNKVNKLEVL